MLKRLFIAHPRSVGESYPEHFGIAARFGVIMIRGGCGALVHALVPGLCTTAGSDALARLNRIIEEHGRAKAAPPGSLAPGE